MLDAGYFNRLVLDVIDDRYYDADRVDEILVDIRRQSLETNAELLALRAKVAELERRQAAPSQSDEFYIRTVHRLYSRIRAGYTDAISELDNEWQSFLASASAVSPDDLQSRVAGIASAIDEIENSTAH